MRTHRSRRIALSVLAVLLLAGVALLTVAVGTVRGPYPKTSGELHIDGLDAPVTVIRDARGVPSIYADSAADLFRAQGFVAAQDRFFEMNLRRQVTAGRLSELVGSAGIASDRMVRTLGWRRVAEQELPLLDPATRQYLQAYADGVNAYLRAAEKPANMGLEFSLLLRNNPSYRVEPWTPVDSLAWLKAMAWDLKADYSEELTRARLAALTSVELVQQLYPDYPWAEHRPILSADDWRPSAAVARPGATQLPASVGAAVADPAVLSAVTRTQDALALAAPRDADADGIGSNSWVVAGSRSATGKPILANDPHMSLFAPSIWTQVGLHCRRVDAACPFDVAGFSFSGMPGVIIGHNSRAAWGFTNMTPDVTDFYLENVIGDGYLYGGDTRPLTTRTETIKVAGGADLTIQVRSTVHGPLVSDVSGDIAAAGARAPVAGVPQDNTYAVSLAWTALTPNRSADAIFALDTMRDFAGFREAARLFAVPAQNMVYADVDGHIGYQAPGAIPVRVSSTPGAPPGFWPAPGWLPEYDWTGYVPFEQMPWSLDPPEGYIVAANQAVTASRTPYLATTWDYGFRSQRIRDLIEAKPTLTVADMNGIQNDTYNAFAEQLTRALLATEVDEFTAQGQRLLTDWNYTQPNDRSRAASAASYFNAVWAQLLDNTFGDEMPRALGPNGASRWMVVVSQLLKDPRNPWWDDKRTPGVIEGRDEILKRSMRLAHLNLVQDLGKDPATWQWGRLHEVTLKHLVMSDPSVPGWIRGMFEIGPLGAPGGTAIVNAFNWNAASAVSETGERFSVVNGPSMRMVVDLGDLNRSTWVNATGQSGHPYHPHYKDQVDAWIDGRTFEWPFASQAVREAAAEELTLLPAADS